jgi:uncharacterized protein
MRHLFVFVVLFLILSTSAIVPAFSQQYVKGSRPAYVYDRANVISSEYESLLDTYLRQIDDSTSAEIVIYTIPSFYGHGIKKNNQEINDRDSLANYIFNEVSLDGKTGIGKKGKDNGILILFSLEPDSANGSMRIEVGKGLEGDITDGTAGAILDSYLVPARNLYAKTGDVKVFDRAFVDTVVALGEKIGYVNEDPAYTQSRPPQYENEPDPMYIALILIFVLGPLALSILSRRRRGYFGGGYFGGGFRGGGGFGGGGGRSGGGGAGR